MDSFRPDPANRVRCIAFAQSTDQRRDGGADGIRNLDRDECAERTFRHLAKGCDQRKQGLRVSAEQFGSLIGAEIRFVHICEDSLGLHKREVSAK